MKMAKQNVAASLFAPQALFGTLFLSVELDRLAATSRHTASLLPLTSLWLRDAIGNLIELTRYEHKFVSR